MRLLSIFYGGTVIKLHYYPVQLMYIIKVVDLYKGDGTMATGDGPWALTLISSLQPS